MPKVKCGFCARELESGALRYVLMWKLFADYDGIINIEDESRLKTTIKSIEAQSPSELQDQIYMENRHVLCPQCREEILDTLASLEDHEPEYETGEGNGQGERNLH